MDHCPYTQGDLQPDTSRFSQIALATCLINRLRQPSSPRVTQQPRTSSIISIWTEVLTLKSAHSSACSPDIPKLYVGGAGVRRAESDVTCFMTALAAILLEEGARLPSHLNFVQFNLTARRLAPRQTAHSNTTYNTHHTPHTPYDQTAPPHHARWCCTTTTTCACFARNASNHRKTGRCISHWRTTYTKVQPFTMKLLLQHHPTKSWTPS